MSEKRYIFECNGNNCLIFENDVWLKIEEVVDLLNKLYEENEQLKKDDLLFFQQVFNILMKYQHYRIHYNVNHHRQERVILLEE